MSGEQERTLLKNEIFVVYVWQWSNLPKLAYKLLFYFLNISLFKGRTLATMKKPKQCCHLGGRTMLETIGCCTVLMHSFAIPHLEKP